MEIYRTSKPYGFRDLLRDEVLFICVMACIYAIVLLWKPERLSFYTLFLPAILFVKNIYDRTSEQRLQQLTFDTVHKEVVLSYKSMFSNLKYKKVPFNQARLEVIETKSKWKIFEPLTLYILKEKMEVFEITKSKDRVSYEALKAIAQAAKDNSIPIIRK